MIAREGLVPIAVACIAAAAVAHQAGALWSLPLWVSGAYLLYLFRETVPDVPNLPLAVLSPGDGHVTGTANDRDPWLDRESCRVRVELDGPGIGVLRSPVEGKVKDYWTSAQPFDQAGALGTTGFSPNCYSIWVQTDEGDDIWVKSLPRGALQRVTFDPGSEYRPRWTPDGRSIVFGAFRVGGNGLYQRRADGTGVDSLLLTGPALYWMLQWLVT